MQIINKIIPNIETQAPLCSQYINKINIYEKERGKWYIKSFDNIANEKLVLNEHTGKTAPEEIIRQLFLYELIHEYGYPRERIKVEQKISFGSSVYGRADIVVYQNDNITPLILCEIKAPKQKNNIQQLKSYLNTEGSPIGVGFNGKEILRFIRPYPKEFDTIMDIPYEHEYQSLLEVNNLLGSLKDTITSRKWTLNDLDKLNKKKQFNLKAKIITLEELILGNAGVDSFDEIFKIIYAKLYDEFEASNRTNKRLKFRVYAEPKITFKEISQLFNEAKSEWKGVFEKTEKIKLTPDHLDIIIGELSEMKLYGANLRIIDEAFEYLVTDVSKGKKGQYFTPRVIIDACVKILNPTRKEYIIDPSCGSAGFLLHSMEYVWEKYNFTQETQKKRHASKYLWGIDFDERTAKISRALMLIAGDGKTHIYKENTLEYANWSGGLIADLEKEELVQEEPYKKLNFDIVLSNPPFSGDVKETSMISSFNEILGLSYTHSFDYGNVKTLLNEVSDEFGISYTDDTIQMLKEKIQEINKDKEIDLEDDEDYNLSISEIADYLIFLGGENLSSLEESSKSELRINLKKYVERLLKLKKKERKWNTAGRHILFIQRILDMLKGGGRTAIVLPQGVFNNADTRYVRRFISQNARILGVIGLHINSFKPHTATKTSVILLRKYTDEEMSSGKNKLNYPFFSATSKISFKDGSGNYIYAYDKEGSLILDKEGNPYYYTDLLEIADAFIDWGKEKLLNGDKAFDFLEDLASYGK